MALNVIRGAAKLWSLTDQQITVHAAARVMAQSGSNEAWGTGQVLKTVFKSQASRH